MGPIGYLWNATTCSGKKRGIQTTRGGVVIIDHALEPVDSVSSAITPPKTPQEPMEFLSRSWSLSASEISKAILTSSNKWRSSVVDRATDVVDNPAETLPLAALPGHHHRTYNGSLAVERPTASLRRLFRTRENNKSAAAKKEQTRTDKARVHSAISVASVAAAVAAVASRWSMCPGSPNSLMITALASATELLASHIVEVAEQTGADHNRVVSVVQSSVDVKTAGELMTLTAAAATSLRAVAALKQRTTHRDGGRYASVVPCGTTPDFICKEGALLKRTRRGALHWKQVTVYINKNSQVTVKLKSKHVGGAFSKRKTCVVYGVYDDIPAWPGRRKGGEEGGIHFGLSTAQGILEFECENEIQKQKWVDGVRNLLRQVSDCGKDLKSLQQMEISL